MAMVVYFGICRAAQIAIDGLLRVPSARCTKQFYHRCYHRQKLPYKLKIEISVKFLEITSIFMIVDFLTGFDVPSLARLYISR
jgi:hypothetical protein